MKLKILIISLGNLGILPMLLSGLTNNKYMPIQYTGNCNVSIVLVRPIGMKSKIKLQWVFLQRIFLISITWLLARLLTGFFQGTTFLNSKIFVWSDALLW